MQRPWRFFDTLLSFKFNMEAVQFPHVAVTPSFGKEAEPRKPELLVIVCSGN
jgi:hypothetical protein